MKKFFRVNITKIYIRKDTIKFGKKVLHNKQENISSSQKYNKNLSLLIFYFQENLIKHTIYICVNSSVRNNICNVYGDLVLMYKSKQMFLFMDMRVF